MPRWLQLCAGRKSFCDGISVCADRGDENPQFCRGVKMFLFGFNAEKDASFPVSTKWCNN